MPLTGKTALVTGATSGIGKAVATALAIEGAQVVIIVRNEARGKGAAADIQAAAPQAPRVHVIQADLSSQADIRKAAAAFHARHPSLHILVNSAAVFRKERHITVDGLEETFATNYLAYFLLTNLLVDALKRGAVEPGAHQAAPGGARVVNVASKYGGATIDFDDLQNARGKFTFLRSTQRTMLERVLFTQEMAARLNGTGVTVNTLHPGLVKHTGLGQGAGGFFRWLTNTIGSSPEVGADTAIWLSTAPDLQRTTGMMFEKRKPIKTPGQGSDAAARERLWEGIRKTHEASMTLDERYHEIIRRIGGRARLIAVTKGRSLGEIQRLYALGQRDFGENRVDAMRERADALPPDARWHFIGHLQRNKVKLLAGCALVHSLDRAELTRAWPAGVPALLQVDFSGGAGERSGVAPGEAPALLAACRAAGVDVRGLSTLLPQDAEARPLFARLRALRDELGLVELSMGMSEDHEAALDEGATMVRVGRAIFEA